MPEEIFGEKYQFLPNREILRYEEITRLAEIFIRLGVHKLRITGGEPLVRKDLEVLIGQLAHLEGGQDLAMTTNGFFLPQKAHLLKEAGLKRVTISLDSLNDAIFRQLNGNKSGVAEVLAGIAAAEQAGLTPIKINAVVKRGVNDHTIVDLARYCQERGYILRLIEFMDVGTRNGWEMAHVVPAQEMIKRIDAALPLEALPENYYGEVAYRFRYRDGGGELGIIASVTKPFCGTCTRLRLSPQGIIYTCLFAVNGTDLRGPMRAGATDDDLIQIIRGVWGKRTDRYSEERTHETAHDRRKIEMYYIGG
jgi:cyclic pyranopterin phosphate synthase